MNQETSMMAEQSASTTTTGLGDTSQWTAKRRDFLRILGWGAGATALGPLMAACGSSNAQTQAEIDTEDFAHASA